MRFKKNIKNECRRFYNMVDIKYANAYSEVLEILKYIPVEDYNKIPKSKIELFEKNANKDYVFKYNSEKTLQEQNVSKIARGVIAILFRDYWATDEQREKIIRKQNYDRQKSEEEKRKLYNLDNMFRNTERITNSNIEKEKCVDLIEIKHKRWYERFWKFVLKAFNKKI